MRWLATLVTALAAALALVPVAAPAAEPRASLADLEDEVMCTICGTTLQLANAPQAEQQRDLIRGLVAEGRTKDEIKDALVSEYGPEVLAVPSSDGFDLAAWVVPVAGILLALVLIGAAARRWRRAGGGAPPGPAGPTGLDPGDEQRLSADLRRYDP